MLLLLGLYSRANGPLPTGIVSTNESAQALSKPEKTLDNVNIKIILE
jgi:hypothetical protein